MCGIAGIVDLGARFGAARLRELAVAMADTLVHRGPDDAGVWVSPDGRCALAHRRLSVIDLRPEGRQPLGNGDGSVQVTFNGEVYNFQELRSRLEAAGHRFASRTDAEVLPHLLEEDAPGRVAELDGMFAFGLWNDRTKRLLLARDRFGKKPLYWARGPGWFAFASEARALTVVPGFDREIDREALAFYLLLQYVPAPWAIWRGARKLEPGALLELDARDPAAEPAPRRWFEFAAEEPGPFSRASFADQVEEGKALLLAAVRKRLVSDVPLGAFLSGGVDSSLIVALLTRELGRQVQTFTLGFEGTDETEHPFARRVADHLGTEHHEVLLKPDALELVQHLARVLDEPNGDSSCLPTFLLARAMRSQVTVALSGDGGDELFGGYTRYLVTLQEEVSRWARLRAWLAGRPPTPASARYLSQRFLTFLPDQVAALVGALPAAVEARLAEWRELLDDGSVPLLHRMRTLDVNSYMPGAVLAKVDRMSMQVALEVRCPLLDGALGEFARRLPQSALWSPPSTTKRLLKELAGRYLPADLVHRRKMGFGIPTQAWSRDRTLEFATDALLGPDGRLRTLLDPAALARAMDHQRAPGLFSIYQVWPLLLLELWLREDAGRPAAL